MEENTRADGSTVVATDQVRELPAVPPPYLNPLSSGTFQWPNGDKFEGEFVKDQCHGVGVHTYADGKQYQGEWLDNKKHGYGILIYPRGEKTEGLLLSPRTRKLTIFRLLGAKSPLWVHCIHRHGRKALRGSLERWSKDRSTQTIET